MIKKESLNKLIIVAIVLCAIVTIFLTYNKHEENQKPELRDTIIVRRNSISKEIDTIYREIIKNNTEYEKDYNIIINNDVDSDYLFFTKYLESRFSSNNNQ